MSLLTDGKIARAVAKGLAKLTTAGTLYSRDAGIDASGNPLATFTSSTVRAIRLEVSAARRFFENIPDGASKAVIMQVGATAAPRAGDRIAISGATYDIVSATADPASATWECVIQEV